MDFFFPCERKKASGAAQPGAHEGVGGGSVTYDAAIVLIIGVEDFWDGVLW